MAISRQTKEELVNRYGELIENSVALIFTDYTGTPVARMQMLRRRMHESDAIFMVVKNRLLAIALDQAGRGKARDYTFTGPMGVVFSGDDIGRTVKDLREFIRQEARGQSQLAITGGLMAQQQLDAQQTTALADLPTMDEMRAKLLGTLSAPTGKLVQMMDALPNALYRVIAAPPMDLTRVLQVHSEQ